VLGFFIALHSYGFQWFSNSLAEMQSLEVHKKINLAKNPMHKLKALHNIIDSPRNLMMFNPKLQLLVELA
jgi:hypothetical protein